MIETFFDAFIDCVAVTCMLLTFFLPFLVAWFALGFYISAPYRGVWPYVIAAPIWIVLIFATIAMCVTVQNTPGNIVYDLMHGIG